MRTISIRLKFYFQCLTDHKFPSFLGHKPKVERIKSFEIRFFNMIENHLNRDIKNHWVVIIKIDFVTNLDKCLI